MKSMTGYGRGEIEKNDRRLQIEMKSVNHRYSDIRIRLPRMLQPLELDIKNKILEEVNRGKVDVFIHFDSQASDDIKLHVNKTLASEYYKSLEVLQTEFSLSRPTLEMLSRFPDIIESEDNILEGESAAEIEELLFSTLDIALEQFINMRAEEGNSLKNDIIARNDRLKELLEEVKERAPLVTKEYEENLREKVEEVLADEEIEEARILTEITLFADRADINEEIVRLESHIKQLEEIVEEKGSVGRKLDFLLQEVNREVNTIASKANDIVISKATIEMKAEAEKIREQVQNIE